MFESHTLSPEERNWCKTKRGTINQRAFGLMIAYFREFINFPSSQDNLLYSLSRVSCDLGIDDDDNIANFDWNGRTAKRYRKEIRDYLGYREASDSDTPAFIEFLISEILPSNPSKESLNEGVRNYFKDNKLEQFTRKQLTRYISSAKSKFEKRFFEDIFCQYNTENKQLIDDILFDAQTNEKLKTIKFSDLKKDIPGARLKNVTNDPRQ